MHRKKKQLFNFQNSYATIFLRLYDRVFSFQNNPKNLDLSCKTDLDLWDCLERGKLALEQNVMGLIQLFVAIVERGTVVILSVPAYRVFTA